MESSWEMVMKFNVQGMNIFCGHDLAASILYGNLSIMQLRYICEFEGFRNSLCASKRVYTVYITKSLSWQCMLDPMQVSNMNYIMTGILLNSTI